jgi:WD40-like Beta Propeller Repeat
MNPQPQNSLTMPSVGEVQVFEELGNNLKGLLGGYFFSVSPDERWVAAIVNGTIAIEYLPTAQVWRQPIPGHSFGPLYAGCFSSDSKKLYYESVFDAPGWWVARLDPAMSRLELVGFAKQPPATHFSEGSFSGDDGLKRNLQGERVGHLSSKGWSSDGKTFYSAEELGYGEWSPDGKTFYKTSERGGKIVDGIQIYPSGRTVAVDYSLLKKVLAENKRESLTQTRANLSPEMAEFFKNFKVEDILNEYLQREVRLDELSISPDGELIAASATFEDSNEYIGVLLVRKGEAFVAHPFAAYYYGKAMWSKDSQRLYYYAQPGASTGEGTVHKLILNRSLLQRAAVKQQ